MTEETLFHEALAKPPAERAALLDQACVGQPQLRTAVEALLAAHDASGNQLDQAPAATGAYVASDGDNVPPLVPQPRTTRRSGTHTKSGSAPLQASCFCSPPRRCVSSSSGGQASRYRTETCRVYCKRQ